MSNWVSFKTYFRLLVLISVALYVGLFFLPVIESRFYSPEEIDLMTWAGYGAAFGRDVLLYIAYGSLIVYGIIGIGLIYFKSWARECFLLLVIVLVLTSFGYGVNILTEASMVYLQVLNIIDGLIIGIIYFSALRKEFKVTHNKALQSDAAKPRR